MSKIKHLEKESVIDLPEINIKIHFDYCVGNDIIITYYRVNNYSIDILSLKAGVTSFKDKLDWYECCDNTLSLNETFNILGCTENVLKSIISEYGTINNYFN